MNFRRNNRNVDDVEINLIPMIDVLLVILIFLMVSTTFSKVSELQINLPSISNNVQQNEKQNPKINVAIDAQERYIIDSKPVAFTSIENLSQDLKRVVGNRENPVIVILADSKAPHQAVVNVMEAAQQAGYMQITFATNQAK